jgi:UDP-N-acetylmuramyl pentapeptide synthase
MALRIVLDRRVEAWRAGPFGRLALATGITAARTWRHALGGVTFVGITGTAGKTTAKDLLLAAAGPTLRLTGTHGTRNRYSAVGRTILGARPRQDACVVEIATARPGDVARITRLVRPRIAIVTNIGIDHRRAFRTLEAIAEEKSALVAALPPDGVAVLNADDPLVLAMASRTRARVVTYGEAEDADLRVTGVTASWPDTLAFTLHREGRTYPVRTRLYGRHWLGAVLGALGGAEALGVPLEQAVAGIAATEPPLGRMSAFTAGGIAFMRDDFKAPYWGFGAVCALLAEARAPRKRLVIGEISNLSSGRSYTYRRLARRGLEVADEVIVVGLYAEYVERLRAEGLAVVQFATTREAAAHVRATAVPGELVVLKGTEASHIGRIALDLDREVACWRELCGRRLMCDACSLLR